MRAGVEIVIGSMCLRQTKQTKSVPDESGTRVCMYTRLFVVCHSVKCKLVKLQDALLSNLQEFDKYSSLISFV